MNRIGYNTMSGMELELKRQEIIASNLAAANVPGYKAEFLLSGQFEGDSGDGLNGVSSGSTKIDYAQGALKTTGRELDFAITGEGFFRVKTSDDQILYTRNGAFTLNDNMQLTTDQGFLVVDENDTAITFLPNDDISNLEISSDGMLKIRGNASNGYVYKNLAKIKIEQINNKEDLQRLTGSYFRMPEGKEIEEFETPQNYEVMNARLETANISPIKSMVQLIQSSREFEMGSRILRMVSEMSNKENNAFGS